jgi:hypothetical protein
MIKWCRRSIGFGASPFCSKTNPLENHHGGGKRRRGNGRGKTKNPVRLNDNAPLRVSTEPILIFIRITMDYYGHICQSSNGTDDDDKVNNNDKVKAMLTLETHHDWQRVRTRAQRTLIQRHNGKPAMARLVGLRRNGAFAATALEQPPAMMMTPPPTTTTTTALSIDVETTTLEEKMMTPHRQPPEQELLNPHHHDDALAVIWRPARGPQ